MLRKCAYEPCGRMFETFNVRRLFCSERCRRSGQNAARREARAEVRAQKEAEVVMADPWTLPLLEDGDIWSNALLDALPAGMDMPFFPERTGSASGGVPERRARSASVGAPAGRSAGKRRPSGSGGEAFASGGVRESHVPEGNVPESGAWEKRVSALSASGSGAGRGSASASKPALFGAESGAASAAAGAARQLFPSA